LARQRLAARPPPPGRRRTPEEERSSDAFAKALLDRDHRAAVAAFKGLRQDAGPARVLTPVQRAKSKLKVEYLAQILRAHWARREEETQGIFRPPPTPEQVAAGRAVLERFKQWMADDSTPSLSSEQAEEV
jgi:hypothetical protein